MNWLDGGGAGCWIVDGGVVLGSSLLTANVTDGVTFAITSTRSRNANWVDCARIKRGERREESED